MTSALNFGIITFETSNFKIKKLNRKVMKTKFPSPINIFIAVIKYKQNGKEINMLCLQNSLFDIVKAVKSMESVIATFPYVLNMIPQQLLQVQGSQYYNIHLSRP